MNPKLRTLSEYFLGTETIKEYKKYVDFYKDFYSDDEELKRKLKSLKRRLVTYITVGKAIPNIFTFTGIAFSILTKDDLFYSLTPIISGEFTRNLWTFNKSQYIWLEEHNKEQTKEKWDGSLEGMVSDTKSKINQYKEFKDKPNNRCKRRKAPWEIEGEEWKKGTIYEDDDEDDDENKQLL